MYYYQQIRNKSQIKKYATNETKECEITQTLNKVKVMLKIRSTTYTNVLGQKKESYNEIVFIKK